MWKNKAIYLKLFVTRALTYTAILQFCMILYLTIREMSVSVKWVVPIFVLSLLLVVVLGYLEVKLGFFTLELKASAVNNPLYLEIIERLERLERR